MPVEDAIGIFLHACTFVNLKHIDNVCGMYPPIPINYNTDCLCLVKSGGPNLMTKEFLL